MIEENDDRARAVDIHHTVHHLDKELGSVKARVSVLEERSKAQAADMKQIHSDIDENNRLINNVAQNLQKNRVEDMQDRAKANRWLIGTLVGVVITLVVTLLQLAIG